jgi:hypothetical protein
LRRAWRKIQEPSRRSSPPIDYGSWFPGSEIQIGSHKIRLFFAKNSSEKVNIELKMGQIAAFDVTEE